MTKSDYESMTVAELKEMAELQGIPLPSDARKADIIDALQALEAEGKSEANLAAELQLVPADDAPEQQNVYTFQTSSTTEANMDQTEFRKVKLTV